MGIKKKIAVMLGITSVITAAALMFNANSSVSARTAFNFNKTDTKVVFLHHSTGSNIWNGGVQSHVNEYNASHGTNFNVTAKGYPLGDYVDRFGWSNYPFDYWNIWVKNGNQAQYLGQDTLRTLASNYDVIMWKHCYPVSGVNEEDGAPSISSSRKSLGNYKLQYNALKQKMHQYPNKLFVVWTGAVMTQSSLGQDQALKMKSFVNWMKTSWDEPNDNIFIWDFYQLETDGGLYLQSQNAASAGDSHPNSRFSSYAAKLLSNRLVNIMRGRGDKTSLTGK